MSERQYQTLRWAPSDAPQFVFPGRGLDEAQTLTADTERMFAQVAVCAEAASACPAGVRVRGCMYDGMRSMDVLDWRAGAGYSESFGHESVHLARYLTTGDPDLNHFGPWWANGKSCQSGLEDA